MNFLSLRRLSPWIYLLATAGCGATPPPSDAVVDGGSRASDTASADTSAGLVPDRVTPAPCAATGTSRLRVSLGLDPGLTMRAPEVWLMVRCAGGDGFERVLRWDRNATQLLDALAPGIYEVRGSSFVAPWSSSTRVMLGDGATAAISLTLPPSPSPLAQLRSDPSVVAGDPVWHGTVSFTSVGNTGAVASLEVDVRPSVSTPPAASDAGFLSVTANVHNPCPTGTCAPYVLRALEIRTRTDGEPTGLSGYAFPQGERLDADEHKSVPEPMVVRGSMPDATHGIEFVLYGEVMRSGAPRY